MKQKKWFVVTGFVLALLLVSACSGQNGDNQQQGAAQPSETSAQQNETPTQQSEAANQEVPTISLMTAWDPGFDISSDSPVFVNWGKEVGVKFNVNIPPRDSYQEKVNITLASDDMPDLFRFFLDAQSFNDYGPQLFVNLKPYLEDGKLPNLQKWFDKYPEIEPRMTNPTDGGIYGFPLIQDFDWVTNLYYVRNDMLKQQGMDASQIKSIDDFKQAALALRDAKGGDYITSHRLGFGQYAYNTMSWFGITQGLGYDTETNSYQYFPVDASARVKEWVELERWMYSEKLLDPNFLTMKDQELFTGYQTGDYPLMREQLTMHLDTMAKAPGAEVVPIYPVPVDGKIRQQPAFAHYNIGYRSPWVINKKAENIEAIIKAMDYTYSDEGIALFMLGVEGETYEIDPATPSGYRLVNVQSVWTQNSDGSFPDGMKRLQDYGYNSWWLTGVAPDYARFNLLNFKEGQEKEALETVNQIEHLKEMGAVSDPHPDLTYTKDEIDAINLLATPLATYTDENLIKFILGQQPMSEWDAFIDGYKNYKVDELKKIFNDKLAQ